MHVLVTGYSNPNKAKKNGKYFADIRIVVAKDDNDNPQDITGNTDSLANSIYNLITQRCQDVLDEYQISPKNIEVETMTQQKPSSVRIAVLSEFVENFLNDNFWHDPIGRLLAHKCYKDAMGNKTYVTIPFAFNPSSVISQIQHSVATQEDYVNAKNDTSNFLHAMFQKLDSPEIQSFLKNFMGSLKFGQGDGNGWEYVQLSDFNSLMVLAQYQKVGITPRFVCNARDWSVYFNRSLKPNAVGAVIEVPLNNKRYDADNYSSRTNGRNLDSDLTQGGTVGYMANWLGYNQNDLEKNFLPGWVFDESQTELMIDSQGNPMPDILNDPTHQRRKTNVGNDTEMAFSPLDAPLADDIPNDEAEQEKPTDAFFQSQTDKIPECLENIKNSISLKRFTNNKGRNKYETVMPLIEKALAKPSVNNMIEVVKELAKCELWQTENRFNMLDGKVRIATSVIMAKCGFGNTTQIAQYARQIITNKNEALEISNVITNITMLINGSMIKQMNENMGKTLCQPTSFDELVQILGIEDVVNNDEKKAQALNEVKQLFFEQLNKIQKKH